MKDGGNAFPALYFAGSWREMSGMSLRDYFAAAALSLVETKWGQEAARHAYQIADAMLTEREKGG